MRRNKYLLGRIIIIGLLVCLLLAGGVFAYMFKKTAVTSNQFVPANIVCTVNETFAGSKKSIITVTNNKEEGSNIDAYLRVMLVTYWVDVDGNIVGKASEMPTVSVASSSGWIEGSDNIYYYTQPVAPGDTTPNLLVEGSPIVLQTSKHDGETVYQVVEVFAEGIQANPETTAETEWGVTIENGVIK